MERYDKTIYGEMSVRQKVSRWSVLTAKCPNGEVSLRRSVLTAKCPHGGLSSWRSFRTAISPTAKCSTAKSPVTASIVYETLHSNIYKILHMFINSVTKFCKSLIKVQTICHMLMHLTPLCRALLSALAADDILRKR